MLFGEGIRGFFFLRHVCVMYGMMNLMDRFKDNSRL